MNEFLQPTSVIDSSADVIVSAAVEIAGDATDDELVARRCFLWVRDGVPERFPDALPSVVAVLQRWHTAEEVARNLPDYVQAASNNFDQKSFNTNLWLRDWM